MATPRHGAANGASPGATVHLRAAQVIAEQRHKLFASVAAAVDGRDPEGVHDMRVASRRMRACLKTFAPWLESEDLARLAPAVRRLTRALGTVRELDVLRLRLATLAAHAAPERALAIEHVDAHLARRRGRARARMMACFAKVDLDRLDARLQRLVTQLSRSRERAGEPAPEASHAAGVANGDPTARAGAVAAEQPVAALLDALARPLLDEARDVCFASIPAEVGSAHAAEALHRVRIAAKKLRYTLEIVVPDLGEGGTEAVRSLRQLQDKVGDFHDDVVLDATLEREVARCLERGRPLLGGELRRLRGARRRVLMRDERAVRAAIVALRDSDFVGLVAGALAAAGVVPPAAPGSAPASEVEEDPADAPAHQPASRRRAAAAATLPDES